MGKNKMLSMGEFKRKFKNLSLQRIKYLECRIQELITDREGMIAENKIREFVGLSPAYGEREFARLSTAFYKVAWEF